MFASKTIKELKIGDSESVSITITEEHINAFAKATDDYNPLHMDSAYAAGTPFGARVAHGVLLTGIVSGILGTKLPGLGTVAREMSAKFSNPAYIGDTVTATIELVEIKERINMCTFKYTVVNQDGKLVVKGKAVVLPKNRITGYNNTCILVFLLTIARWFVTGFDIIFFLI
ncbi:MAG: MaoC family dehydratase [Elusimicrobiota bacterium]